MVLLPFILMSVACSNESNSSSIDTTKSELDNVTNSATDESNTDADAATVEEISIAIDQQKMDLVPGEQQQLTASVLGTAETAVDWSVEGGDSNGTIDSTGLYTAPTALPEYTIVSIRATSVADTTKSATTQISLFEPDGGGLRFEHLDLVRDAYSSGFTTNSILVDTNIFAAKKLFFASCLNGNQPTGTGSLRLNESNYYEYSPSPRDHLQVYRRNASRVDIVYQTAHGDIGDLNCDDWQQFLDQHDPFKYWIGWNNSSLNIESRVVPEDALESQVSQHINGEMSYRNQIWTIAGLNENTSASRIGSEYFSISQDAQGLPSGSHTRNQYNMQSRLSSNKYIIDVDYDYFYERVSNSYSESMVKKNGFNASITDGVDRFDLVDMMYQWRQSTGNNKVYSGEGLLYVNEIEMGSFIANERSGQMILILDKGGKINL